MNSYHVPDTLIRLAKPLGLDLSNHNNLSTLIDIYERTNVGWFDILNFMKIISKNSDDSGALTDQDRETLINQWQRFSSAPTCLLWYAIIDVPHSGLDLEDDSVTILTNNIFDALHLLSLNLLNSSVL